MSRHKDAAVSVARWQVPPVRLEADGTMISWSAYYGHEPWPAGDDPKRDADRPSVVDLTATEHGPFLEFLRLASVEPADPNLGARVHALAKQVGPLRLCADHGWPYRHHRRINTDVEFYGDPDAPTAYEECPPASKHEGAPGLQGARGIAGLRSYRELEPVARWHQLAVQGRLAIDIAVRLRGSDPGTPIEDWEQLDSPFHLSPSALAAITRPMPVEFGGIPPSPRLADHYALSAKERLARQRMALTAFVQQWLDKGRVKTRLDWVGKKPRMSLGAGDLFGYLALQLALRVLSRRGLAFCAQCSRDFEPERMDVMYCSSLCRDDARAETGRARRKAERDKLVPERIVPKALRDETPADH